MLNSIVKAFRETAGQSALGAPVGNKGGALTYRWRNKGGVWHPESGEPPLVGGEAVARAMLAKPTNAPAPDVAVHEQRESTGAQRVERKKGTG